MGRTTISSTLAAAFLLTLGACSPPAEEAPPERKPPAESRKAPTAEDEAALREIVARWDESMNAMDAAAVLDLYAGDAVMMPPDAPAQRGGKAIGAYLEGLFVRGAIQVMDTMNEARVSGAWAFNHGNYRLTVTPAGGGAPVEETGTWAAVNRREADGSWSVVRNIWNTDAPGEGRPGPPGAERTPLDEVPSPDSPVCVKDLAGLDGAFMDAFVAGDLATVTALHARGGMRMPPGMPSIRGRAEVAAYTKAYLDAFDPRDLTVTQEGHQVAGGWGFSWGAYRADYTARDGSGSFRGEGKYLSVGRRGRNGCWRIEWVLWNGNAPPGA